MIFQLKKTKMEFCFYQSGSTRYQYVQTAGMILMEVTFVVACLDKGERFAFSIT